MKKLLSLNRYIIVLIAIWSVFVISRIIAYLVIVSNTLPDEVFLSVGTYRLHHFVYGNIIIATMGFLALVAKKKMDEKTSALIYGIGLGLVLDEFVLWMGDVGQLTGKVLFIPYSFSALAIVSIIILGLYYFEKKDK